MNKEVVQAESTVGSALESISRAEFDVAVETAKRYPRDVEKAIAQACRLVTLDVNAAEECSYSLPRKDQGRVVNIEGPSIRLAEAIRACWGNIKVATRILEIGERFVTAQAACVDLESVNYETSEVQRRITTRQGVRYSDDMIQVTCNAAAAIAKRNVLLAIIPRAAWSQVWIAAQDVAANGKTPLTERRSRALAWFAARGADATKIIEKLGLKAPGDITADHLATLNGWRVALNEGRTTIEDLFAPEQPEDEADEGWDEPADEMPTPKEAPLETQQKQSVFVTGEEEPSGERAELWALWEDYRTKLTPEQLKEVRKLSGVGKIRADISLDNLRAVVKAAEQVLGM